MVVGSFVEEVDTVVIGSGPGGYVAAIHAAQKGEEVVLVEKGDIGGVCLNVGCIPSKALISVGKDVYKARTENPYGLSYEGATLDFSKTQKWKDEEVVNQLTSGIEALLRKYKVEIVKGTANFSSKNRVSVVQGDEYFGYDFEHAIIATGSSPIELPGFEFNEDILDSTALLNLDEIPESLVVVGGGYIGMELAFAYSDLGSDVTVVENLDRVLNAFEKDLTRPVLQAAEEKGISIVTGAKASSYEKKEDRLTLTYEKDGESEEVDADKIAVMVGRTPNTEELSLSMAGVKKEESGHIQVDDYGETTTENIYAIGDVVPGPALAHKASYEAKMVVERISGNKGAAIDYLAIPTVCYSSPEIATVGLTYNEAKEQGMEVEKAKYNFANNGRALSTGETEGFVRLISDAETERIVGAQMVGANVDELINNLALAIENLLTVEDVSLTIHSHPSLSESILDVSEILLGEPTHQ
ncbi:MAG: dihydrolipoyl dehydrogenase [Atopostipes sp.]|nr:dihydrolipoyl dehydrogenase [Atopostipes sp.]